jgi:hypothetical protein
LLYFPGSNLLQSPANGRVNGRGRNGFANRAEIERVSRGGSSMRGRWRQRERE